MSCCYTAWLPATWLVSLCVCANVSSSSKSGIESIKPHNLQRAETASYANGKMGECIENIAMWYFMSCLNVCRCPSTRVWFVLTQAVRAVYGEAHEDDISVWIGERSQPVIVLLTRSVPESQLHLTDRSIVGREGREKDKGMWRKARRESEEKKKRRKRSS